MKLKTIRSITQKINFILLPYNSNKSDNYKFLEKSENQLVSININVILLTLLESPQGKKLLLHKLCQELKKK